MEMSVLDHRNNASDTDIRINSLIKVSADEELNNALQEFENTHNALAERNNDIHKDSDDIESDNDIQSEAVKLDAQNETIIIHDLDLSDGALVSENSTDNQNDCDANNLVSDINEAAESPRDISKFGVSTSDAAQSESNIDAYGIPRRTVKCDQDWIRRKSSIDILENDAGSIDDPTAETAECDQDIS